ncbi:ParB-like nuclease domain protein [compost metagenome]
MQGSKGGSFLRISKGSPTVGKASSKAVNEPSVTQVDPRNLIPTQTKSEMSGSQIKRLEKSMMKDGFDQSKPVDAWKRPDGRLEIQDGHHRTEAAKKAELKSIPVRVWE